MVTYKLPLPYSTILDGYKTAYHTYSIIVPMTDLMTIKYQKTNATYSKNNQRISQDSYADYQIYFHIPFYRVWDKK